MAYSDTDLTKMAITAIYNYYDKKYTQDYIRENFDIAVNLLANRLGNMFNNSYAGATSIKEGNQSITFESGYNSSNLLTSDILAFLPKKVQFHVW